MARPPDPLKEPAIADIIKHLEAGADPGLLRVKYHTVKTTSWWNWLKEATGRFTAAGGVVQKPAITVRGGKAKVDPAVAAATAAPRPKRQAPAPPPATGEVLPRDEVGAPAGVGVVLDGVYVVQTMFGPKEYPVVTRFTDPPNYGPGTGLAILEKLTEVYLDAGALRDSCMKKVGDGHAILDRIAYAAAVDLQRKALGDMLKTLEKSRNLDSIQSFCSAVVERIAQQSPADAARMIQTLRQVAQQYSSRQWQTKPTPATGLTPSSPA